jgi:ubiquinone/menaquinone biosynthesis C-methylase UbiE
MRSCWQSRAVQDFERGAWRGGRIVAIARAGAIVDRRVPAGAMVVDVGCGAGLLATKLSRHRVVGADFSAPLLAAAVCRAASVAMASAFALPFRDASAAAVVCLFVGDDYQTPEKRRIVGELVRVSSTGGVVVLGAYAPADDRMCCRRREFSKRVDSQPVFLEHADFYVSLLRDAGASGVHSEAVATTGVSTAGSEDRVAQ